MRLDKLQATYSTAGPGSLNISSRCSHTRSITWCATLLGLGLFPAPPALASIAPAATLEEEDEERGWSLGRTIRFPGCGSQCRNLCCSHRSTAAVKRHFHAHYCRYHKNSLFVFFVFKAERMSTRSSPQRARAVDRS